ncbi:MAG: TlpA disulfide reductase family protein [Thermodesulfovibrionales bacterium]
MVLKHLLLPCIIFCILCVPAVRPAAAAGPGAAAPDFTLPDAGGKKVSLAEGKGKAILLHFWATWCGPCRAEMLSLSTLYREFRDKGLLVLAVSVDTSAKPVHAFLAEQNIPFPVLLDTEREVYFDTYAVFGLPTSFLINRDGVIAERIVGETAWDSPAVKEKVRRLLPEK